MRNKLINRLLYPLLLISMVSFSQNKHEGDWYLYHIEKKESGWGSSLGLELFTFQNNQVFRRAIPENEYTDTLNYRLTKDSLTINNYAYVTTKQTDSIIYYESDTYEYKLRFLKDHNFRNSDFDLALRFLTANKTAVNDLNLTHSGITSSYFILDFKTDTTKHSTSSVIDQPCTSDRGHEFSSKEYWSLELYNGKLILDFSTSRGGGILFVDEIKPNYISGQVVNRKTGDLKTVKIIKL